LILKAIETVPSLAELLVLRKPQNNKRETADSNPSVKEALGDDDTGGEEHDNGNNRTAEDEEVDEAWLFLDALLRPDRNPRRGFKHQVRQGLRRPHYLGTVNPATGQEKYRGTSLNILPILSVDYQSCVLVLFERIFDCFYNTNEQLSSFVSTHFQTISFLHR
jgi:hypothetical protein